MKIVGLPVAFLGIMLVAGGQAQQPWQKLQMPTAAEVMSRWNDPPPEYGPEPYYGFNGPMNVAVIRRDLDHLKALGFEAVTVQAGRDMPAPYLSDGYFSLFRVLVDEAKQRNMRVWIVDDAGYPSGFAGGKFSELKSEMRMQALVAAAKITVQGGEVFKHSVTPATVGAIAVNAGDQSTQPLKVTDSSIEWTAPPGSWQVVMIEHQFRTSPTRSDTNPKRVKDGSQSLEDYLDPAATAQYIAFTHEQYKRTIGDEFGKTILGFRGDEPDYSIGGVPWTPALFAQFEKDKGYDVRPYVPAFFATKLTDEQKRAKAHYWDVFAAMFRDGFFKVQGEWCAANHLEYQVHLNHEEMQMQLVRSEGDFFRDMRYVQVPGIDAIWHQIMIDTVSDFPRLASSAAHVYGRPRSFTESFAAYRPIPSLDQARYILNEQFVRGVNLVEAMYFPSSAGETQPLQGFMSDPGFPSLMQYTRRLSYLMAMGRPTASVALYLPTSTLWLGDASADEAFVSTERFLSEHQIDFDVVDEDALAKELIARKGTLETLSGNGYKTVIFPNTGLLSQQAVDRLRTFAKGGGHVVFLGCAPSLISGKTILDARRSTAADFSWAQVETAGELSATPTPPAQPPAAPPTPQIVPEPLQSAIERVAPSDLKLDNADRSLRYTRRQWKDAVLYLFFNEGAAASSHNVTLITSPRKSSANRNVEAWDPQTGKVTSLASTLTKEGIDVTLPLEPYQTRIVVVR